MGARRVRSKETALELLTEQIRTAWAETPKTIASLLSLVIARAYDQCGHKSRPIDNAHWY
jgi:hypothetical protein